MAEETEEELLDGLEPLNVEEMICDDQDDSEKDETLNEYLNVRFPPFTFPLASSPSLSVLTEQHSICF